MTKVRSSGGDGKQDEDDFSEALAILISVTHSKKRFLPLTDIARWLDVAVSKLGSYQAVADRLGLSAKMLRQFSYVRRLAKPVQSLFASRKLDSVDAAAHLAMLSFPEQQKVASALESGQINTIDARAVVELRKKGDTASISALLDRVKKSKTKKEYVAEFVVRGVVDYPQLLRAFHRYIPARDIVKLELNGVIGRLVLTDKGHDSLKQAAKRLSTPLSRVIPAILQERSAS